MKSRDFSKRVGWIPLVVLMFLPIGLTRGIAADDIRLAADRPFDMEHIKLELDVDVAGKHVDGTATLTMSALRRVSSVKLDAVDFETHAVKLAIGSAAATDADYENDGEQIVVSFDKPLPRGQAITLTIDYTLDKPKRGLNFQGPSDDDPDAPLQVWSQGQSITNRYWVPCFDHPNERQTTEIIVTVARNFQAISNGRLVSKMKNGDKTTYHWLQDKPHVSYLITLVVGEFAVKEETWRGIPVTYYVPPDREADIENSFGNTLRMLDFFSDKIGVEYPWDKYAQLCCYRFGGGMENTSATTLGERTLHDDRAHLDTSSDSLVAHELAHQWFGNMTTCREWAHLWLNEGFASFFEALWTEHDLGADEYALNMHNKARGALRGGKEKPIVYRHYDRPGEQFDSRAYPKGAWVLHMLRERLGEEIFWKAINRFAEDNAFRVVETSDFRRAVEQVSGLSLERFFYDWTGRPGHPVLEVELKWKDKEGVAEVAVKQTQEDEAFHFPLRLDFHVGDDAEPTVVIHDVTEKEVTYTIPLPSEPKMFRVDPGNTVLKEITEKKGRPLWVTQLTADPDPIGRLRAAQHLGKNESDANRKLLARALEQEEFWGVRSEIARVLGQMGGDAARNALIAGARFEHPKARLACVEALANFEGDEQAIDVLRKIVDKGDASYRVEAAAITSFAALDPDDATAVVKSTLTRDSHREQIRNAALRALGKLKGAQTVDTLIAWTGRDKPAPCRRTAIDALAEAATDQELDDETVERTVRAIADCLHGTDRRTRVSAARALGKFGTAGAPALALLRKTQKDDSNRGVRNAAKKSIDSILEDWPIEDQVADLRVLTERLLEENNRLRQRLEKLETERSSPAHAQGPDAAAQPAAAKGNGK